MARQLGSMEVIVHYGIKQSSWCKMISQLGTYFDLRNILNFSKLTLNQTYLEMCLNLYYQLLFKIVNRSSQTLTQTLTISDFYNNIWSLMSVSFQIKNKLNTVLSLVLRPIIPKMANPSYWVQKKYRN